MWLKSLEYSDFKTHSTGDEFVLKTWYTIYRCDGAAQILATLIFGIPCLFGQGIFVVIESPSKERNNHE